MPFSFINLFRKAWLLEIVLGVPVLLVDKYLYSFLYKLHISSILSTMKKKQIVRKDFTFIYKI